MCEVAVPVLRPGSVGFSLPLCKNGDDATRAPRSTPGGSARSCDTRCSRVMGGPWAKQKRTSEGVTANVIRAQIADQRSYGSDHATSSLVVIAARIHAP